MKRIKRSKRIVKTACCARTKKGKIPFTLARSTGRRSLTISVDENADVNVASPFNMGEREIYNFISEKAQWINEKVNEARNDLKLIDKKKFDHGHKFLFLGRKYMVNVTKGRVKRTRISFDVLTGWTVTIPQELAPKDAQYQIKDKMVKWYRSQAEEILGGRIFHYARLMGVEPKKIAVRTQKNLWGCCDYNKRSINLNWLIILSPIKVIDYVVIHELCHLTIPNHSKRFWNKVAKFMPDFKNYRKWLKSNHLDMVLP